MTKTIARWIGLLWLAGATAAHADQIDQFFDAVAAEIDGLTTITTLADVEAAVRDENPWLGEAVDSSERLLRRFYKQQHWRSLCEHHEIAYPHPPVPISDNAAKALRERLHNHRARVSAQFNKRKTRADFQATYGADASGIPDPNLIE